jgi:hypothetical protein
MCSEAVIIIFSRRAFAQMLRAAETHRRSSSSSREMRYAIALSMKLHTSVCLCIGQIERHLLMACVSIEKLSVHKNVFAHSLYCANALLFVNYDIREPQHTKVYVYTASESGYWAAWEPRGAKCCH